jgi:hypothetical protein
LDRWIGPTYIPPTARTLVFGFIIGTVSCFLGYTASQGADTEALKHKFFLRGFFHRRGFYNLAELNPSEREKSNFVKKPARRIWPAADGMFTKSENASQQLSAEGKLSLRRHSRWRRTSCRRIRS